MKLLTPIKTLYYGLIIRIKLSWYTRIEKKMKKSARKVLFEKFTKLKINQKALEKISDNYLNISEILLDRKNLKTAFSFHYMSDRRKDNSN